MPKISVEMRKNGFTYYFKDTAVKCIVKKGSVVFTDKRIECSEYDRCIKSILDYRRIIDVVSSLLIIIIFAINVLVKQLGGDPLSYLQFAIIGCVIVLVSRIWYLCVYCKLEYLFDKTIANIVKKNDEIISILASCSRINTYTGETRINCPKKNAGATHRLNLKSAHFVYSKLPTYLSFNTNTKFYQIKSGKIRCIFLPDRLLLVNGRTVRSTLYKDIGIAVWETQFISEGSAPSDAEIESRTWRYANVNGSRDRRYNNNYTIPVYRYAKVEFYTSQTTLITIMASSYRKAYNFKYAWDNRNKAF